MTWRELLPEIRIPAELLVGPMMLRLDLICGRVLLSVVVLPIRVGVN